ncbi:MAG: hypothetical protein NC914_01800 [Candidatus Omnitrophica bacterium]|nr:hypothetical protein [Candidatus Omnitrophota bacterium]
MDNATPKPHTIRLYLEDWHYSAAGDGTKVFVPAGASNRSCAGWINFSPSEFTIPAFGRQRISYSLSIPPDASGGYYAALFFETKMTQANEETNLLGLNLVVRIASLFYVEVEGTIKRSAELSNLMLTNNPQENYLSLNLEMTNTGNVDITAGGSYHILDTAGIVCARGELNNVYTFSGEKAKFSAKWNKALPQGKYDLVLTINLGKAVEEAGLGRGPVLTKEAEIEIGPDGQIASIGVLK